MFKYFCCCKPQVECNLPKPDNPNDGLDRYLTFIDSTYPQDRQLGLAEAGFYYFGEPDAVKCAFCHIIIRKWKYGDHPVFVHWLQNRNCPFLSGEEVNNKPVITDPLFRFGASERLL